MNNPTRKLLFDILDSGRSIQAWCEDADYEEYETNRQLRRAVEREFEIIGEALNHLAQSDAETALSITHLARIVGFRNRIIHGYDTIDNATVWGVIERYLPSLLTEVDGLLT
jgi:uncharacterized protein with HEPN domain